MFLRASFTIAVLSFVLASCGGKGGGPSGGADAGPGADSGPGGDAGPEGPEVVTCDTEIAPPTSEACDVTPGASTQVMILGDVLAPDATYENGGVVYDGDTIVCVGCDCESDTAYAGATRVACAGSAISAGLINAHDHLAWNERAPIDVGTKRYNHRHEWRSDLSTPANQHGTGADSTGMRWSELRHLVAGTTSLVSENDANGGVRNLERPSDEERDQGFRGLEFETFSLGDSSSSSTLQENCNWDYRRDLEEVADFAAYLPHVAEGIDDYAAEEFRCQSTSFDGGRDFTESNTAHIHSVGLNAIDYWHMAHDKAQLIWSPRSNLSLYGVTAGAHLFDRFGGTLALGTDWTYSGSGSIVRELACAAEYNENYLGSYFSDADLWLMATLGGAKATNTADLIGSLEVGKLADIAIYSTEGARYHRAVIDAMSGDVALVVAAGTPVFGETDAVTALGQDCETTEVCGSTRALCATTLFGESFANIESDAKSDEPAYPIFFCSPPADEPTCIPSRPGEYTGLASAADSDGDGLPDASDNCPDIFNPIRPMDKGVQPDYDSDGTGDACDDSPLVADIDSDGVENDSDNCPFSANDTQDDGDSDNKGDVCDFCPQVANEFLSCPAAPAVPATISEIQDGTLPQGTEVTVEDAVVTAVWSNGVWVQNPSGGAFSGINIFTGPSHGLVRGDVVTVTGEIEEYYGDTELSNTDVTKTGTAAVPAPTVITAAQAATEDYEGVLVTISDAVLSSSDYDCTQDDADCFDTDLWSLNGDSIVVWSRAYEDANWAGQIGVVPVTGVMSFRFDSRRILPSKDDDFGSD